MTVLIKNVEKPENCLECQFYSSIFDYCHALKDNLSQKEWETKSRCPLIEVEDADLDELYSLNRRMYIEAST